MKELSAAFIVVMLAACTFNDLKLAWTVAGICSGLYGLVLVIHIKRQGQAK